VQRSAALTPRQQQVVTFVASGATNKEIAHELGITERGVAAHISRLMLKFAASSRAGLVGQLGGAAPTLAAREYEQYEHSPYIVAVLLGPDHVLAYVNKRFEQVAGRSARDVLGRTTREAFPEITSEAMAMADAVYTTGEARTRGPMTARWQEANGMWHDGAFNVVQQPLRDASGRVVGILELSIEAPRPGGPSHPR
jgi:DNA-binding CsgD family transcriptional regulator